MSATRSRSKSSRSSDAAATRARSRAEPPSLEAADRGDEAPAGAAAAAVASGVLAGAAGMLGGIVLGRTKLMRRRKVLGVRLPIHADAVEQLADSIRAAGREFGKLSREVRSARQTAEQLGKALK